jgi:hypothetical protein
LAATQWLSGCVDGCGSDPFDPTETPRPTPGPGDDDDDDSSPAVESPPAIQITGIDPSTPPFSGYITFSYRVTDPDSTGFEVEVFFGIDGVASISEDAEHKAALAVSGDDPTELPNPFELQGISGAPPIDYAGSFAWNTLQNIPTATSDNGAAIRLCPIDSEGNPGSCVDFPQQDDTPLIIENTQASGLGAFCQPGHLEETNWLSGQSIVPLSDGSCLNYKRSNPPQPDDFSARFLISLVNLNPEDVVYSMQWIEGLSTASDTEPTAGEITGKALASASNRTLTRSFQRAPDPWRLPQNRKVTPPAGGLASGPGGGSPRETCTPDLSESDVNFDSLNFSIREDITDESRRIDIGGTLRALGDSVAIYVDDDTPIDVDLDCADPENPIDESDLETGGFNNCDLEPIVDIVDQNIFPTLTALYGEPSDVDQNCRVTVFISHRLNNLSRTNETEDDDFRLVRSFAEPERDLWETDDELNPKSNEQEIIYAYSPDPAGFLGAELVQLDTYLSFELAGRIAVSLQDLISYNVHRGVGKAMLVTGQDETRPPPEADWLNDGLGLLAADVTGFGATAYPEVWLYMDAPYLFPLQFPNTLESFLDRGGQYLFARYLNDLYGDPIIWQIIHGVDAEGNPLWDTSDPNATQPIGMEAIARLLPSTYEGYEPFLLEWATALGVSGRLNEAGDQLVVDDVVQNFKASGIAVVADPQNPLPDELYGANGFQLGFNVRGNNRSYVGGTDPAGPTELVAARVKTENLDPLLYHPQTDFYGTIAGMGGVANILVSGLEQPVNYLLIETVSGEDLRGTVVRLNDYDPNATLPLILENVPGSLFTDVKQLGELDPEGVELNVIGLIEEPDTIPVTPVLDAPDSGDDDDDDDATTPPPADDDSEEEVEEDEVEIHDTDRYGFSLSATTTIGIWADRRVANIEGESGLSDIFLAVALLDDVPDAYNYDQWNFGPFPSNGVCAELGLYNYPQWMPPWIANQGNLIPDPLKDLEYEPVTSDPTASYDCLYDHDQDGIPDAEEAEPTTLMAQIRQRQAENLAGDPDFYADSFGLLPDAPNVSVPFWSHAFIDFDSNEFPDNTYASFIASSNIGGTALSVEEEEAVWSGTLPPGDYVIIVGAAPGETGPYDLSVRVIF